MNEFQHTDVLIVGGGAAGIAAAVAAARKGSTVTVIERNEYPGGKATAAEVGTVCGLYTFSKTTASTYIVKGFAKEFADALQKSSGTKPLSSTEGLHYLPYDINAFKDLCLQLLQDNGVTIHFNSTVEKLVVENNLITAAFMRSGDNVIEIKVKSIIDCSGDSIVSQSANLPLLKSDHYQAAAQVFTLHGVEEENESRLGMILMKSLRSAIDDNKLDHFFDRVYIVQGSLKNNTVSLKIGIPVEVTYEPGNLEELKEKAQGFVIKLADFLIEHVPVFRNAFIQHIASEPGIRVGFRSEGNYILTEEDVLSCKKFDDAIANASWPIEEWEQHKRVKMRYFSLDDFYQVPARCLISKMIQNLFMAGRNISATNSAIASARVMGICLQTGYAAGYLAAAKAAKAPQFEAIKSIQNNQL